MPVPPPEFIRSEIAIDCLWNIFETARHRWEKRELLVLRLYDEFLRGIKLMNRSQEKPR